MALCLKPIAGLQSLSPTETLRLMQPLGPYVGAGSWPFEWTPDGQSLRATLPLVAGVDRFLFPLACLLAGKTLAFKGAPRAP